MTNSAKSDELNGSLLSPAMMGGIVGSDGFAFQARFTVCHLPLWLLDESFAQLLYEGTGDIDLRFNRKGKTARQHIQVKNHDVTPTELRGVIEVFLKIDAAHPGTYERFVLACPALSESLRSIESALGRYRGAKPYYDDIPSALEDTVKELDRRIATADLQEFRDFIVDKLFIEVGHGDLRYDDRAVELFIARLLSLPQYARSVREMVQPAFGELMRAVAANRGVTLDRKTTEQLVQNAIRAAAGEDAAVVIWVQNWTSEIFDPPADYSLDWSTHFDRATRRVPSTETWNHQLVPELQAVHKEILSSRKERLLRIRGKCSLSTGIALGLTFPTVGGWSFEVPQPPADAPWRSDVASRAPYEVRIEMVDGIKDAEDLVVGINVTGDGKADVVEFCSSSDKSPRLYVFLSGPVQGARGISGAEEAVAFAAEVREHIGRFLKLHRLSSTRLFYYGPFALAVFLGQRLTSMGTLHLFEYQNPGYVATCSLVT